MAEGTSWREINQTADLLKVVEQHVPALAGKFNGRMTPEVPCPKCGGKTRFRVRLGKNGLMMAFCSHCAEHGLTPIDYIAWYNGWDFKTAAAWWQSSSLVCAPAPAAAPVRAEPLPMEIALQHHVGMHPLARKYMYARGMSDPWIDHFLIGYNRELRRYSFPLIINHKLWGLQYRIDPRVEWVIKFLRLFQHPERRVELLRYISETGSHNHAVFAATEISRPWPYAILIEGVADTVAMWSAGFPTVATFQGNNRARPWDHRWNKYFDKISTVYVIPDNDTSGAGDFFAEMKVQEIGNKAHIHRLPLQFKDVGEFIQADVSTAQRRLTEMLVLYPVPDLLGKLATPTSSEKPLKQAVFS